MSLNVLWVTSVYPSDFEPGSGVFHETQVQALTRLGIEVTVICPVPQNPVIIRGLKKNYQKGLSIPEIYLRKGVMVYRPRYMALPGQLRWAQPDQRLAKVILQTISTEQLEPDLIHAHFAMPSGGAVKRVGKSLKLPWVLTLHGSDVNVYPNYSRSAKHAFFRAVKGASTVLAVGKSLQVKTKEMTGRDSCVLPIGVDLDRFSPSNESKTQIRERLKLPQDKKLLTYIGRLVETKGIFELTKALDQLPEEVAVVLVGEGPSKEKLSQHPELSKRLFLPGQVENERVRDYLQASEVFVLPSYSEGMPTVLIEAIALKVPVISTAVGGVPDLFKSHKDFLIEPKSITQLVNRIKSVLYDKGYSTELLNDLYNVIQVDYHANQNAKMLVSVYQKTLNESYLSV